VTLNDPGLEETSIVMFFHHVHHPYKEDEVLGPPIITTSPPHYDPVLRNAFTNKVYEYPIPQSIQKQLPFEVMNVIFSLKRAQGPV
jgi:hypothetical protein